MNVLFTTALHAAEIYFTISQACPFSLSSSEYTVSHKSLHTPTKLVIITKDIIFIG